VDDDYAIPIMEALLDIRTDTRRIIALLEGDDEQEGEEEADL
jgi:hypothetical protein